MLLCEPKVNVIPNPPTEGRKKRKGRREGEEEGVFLTKIQRDSR